MDPQTQILAQILAPARLTTVVDVGANPIDGDPPYKAMLVPEQAVLSDGNKRFVFVVGDKDLLEKRAVSVGQAHDGLRALKTGLTALDRVVVGGLDKLRAGMAVSPRRVMAPGRMPSGSGLTALGGC